MRFAFQFPRNEESLAALQEPDMAISGIRRIAVAVLVALGLAAAALEAKAQTPFTGAYTFSSTSGTASPFAYNGTPILNLTVGDLTRTNLPVSSSAGNFRSSGFALDPVVGSLTGTFDPSKYFEFTLTASPGFTFNLETINFGAGRSGTGPRSFLWRSSVDNYSATIPSYSSLGTSGLFSSSSGTLSFLTDSTATTGTNVVLSLSGSSSSFQGLSTISLRFYGFNSEGTAGTGGFQGPLTFTGALLGSAGSAYTWSGGAGNWQNGQSGNFGQSYTNSPTATTTFNGTGDVVAVSGTVEAATMTVDSAGYSFQGGTISLANATVAVNADSTSIASVLTGTVGLVKTGTGSLSLSGPNTYVGLTNVSGGRLVIASDSALGDTANDLSLAGSTLKTTASISMAAGRDVTGSGTLDIAPGTTLTSSGSFNLTSTTLSNSGTLDLQGATRSVGTLTFGTAATVNGSGAISASGLTATAVTSGSAIINPAFTFTSNGNKTVDVGSGGTLVLGSDVAGTTGRIAKQGGGTLIVNGSNSTAGYQLGVSGTAPTNGGTLILGSAAASGTGQLQFNYGTLQASGSFTFANGLSVGGRSGAVAILGGTNAMTFSGSTSFFRGAGTNGELRLDVNNATTFTGVLGVTGGTGTASGITIGGTGSLAINGNASALLDAITIQDSLDLLVGGTLGSGVTAQAGTLLGGAGTISGPVIMANNSILAPGTSPGTLTIGNALLLNDATILNFELSASDQTVGGGVNDLVSGITNLTLDGVLNVSPIGDFSTVAAGTKWRLFDYSGTLSDLALTLGSMPTLASGNSFVIDTSTTGQVNLQVVPEPSSIAIVGLGLAAAGYAWRRRRTGRA